MKSVPSYLHLWIFFDSISQSFQPAIARTVPSRAQIQILANSKRAALGNEKGSARAALHVAFAFINCFGTDEDLTLGLQYIVKSAKLGCLPARVLLCMQEKTSKLSSVISSEANVSPFDGALFIAKTTLNSSLIQALSPSRQLWRRCLELEMLPQPEGANSQPKLASDTLMLEDGTNTLLIASQLGDIDALHYLVNLNGLSWPCDRIGPSPLHYLYMFDEGENILERALKMLLPKYNEWKALWSYCSEPQIIDPQLPFKLTGAPLDFAVAAGSFRTVEKLLEVDAIAPESWYRSINHQRPWNEHPLVRAIACRRADIFELLSEACRIRSIKVDWHPLSIRFGSNTNGVKENLQEHSLLASLSKQSYLERWILHGDQLQQNRLATISALFKYLYVVHQLWNKRISIETHVLLGLIEILELRDLQMAKDIVKVFPLNKIKPAQSNEQRYFLKRLLNIACGGNLSLKEAAAYVDFGISMRLDLLESPQFQAIIGCIQHHNEALFLHLLLTGHEHFHEVDDMGHGTLWHMIDNDFSRSVPLSKVLEIGIDPNIIAKDGRTTLHHTISKNYLPDVVDLIETGADLWKVSSLGETVLHSAASADGFEVFDTTLRALLADEKPLSRIVNAEFDGKTALHCASTNCNPSIMKGLLENGAFVMARGSLGETPLHNIFEHDVPSFYESVELLLERGANPFLLTHSGRPPIHGLSQWSDASLDKLDLEFFTKFSLHQTLFDKQGINLLHIAAYECRESMIKKLLDWGVDMNILDHQNRTPLHHCIRQLETRGTKRSAMDFRRFINSVDLILSQRPDLTVKDENNYSVLDIAIQNCSGSHFDYGIAQLIELLRHLLDWCCKMEKEAGLPPNSRPIHLGNSSQYNYGSTDSLGEHYGNLLNSAWELAVSCERWHAVKEIMARRPVGTDLIQFPRGARLLEFAIEHSDVYLLQRFLGNSRFELDYSLIARQRQHNAVAYGCSKLIDRDVFLR